MLMILGLILCALALTTLDDTARILKSSTSVRVFACCICLGVGGAGVAAVCASVYMTIIAVANGSIWWLNP